MGEHSLIQCSSLRSSSQLSPCSPIALIGLLFWPVLEPPAYHSPGSILDGFLRYSMGWYEGVQLGLVLVALVVWYRDGTPGLDAVRRRLEQTVSKTA